MTSEFIYCKRANIIRGLYIYYPIFEGQKRLFLKGAFFVKFSPYSRVGYDGARTVKFGHSEKATKILWPS